jgi:hypothetical protein
MIVVLISLSNSRDSSEMTLTSLLSSVSAIIDEYGIEIPRSTPLGRIAGGAAKTDDGSSLGSKRQKMTVLNIKKNTNEVA